MLSLKLTNTEWTYIIRESDGAVVGRVRRADSHADRVVYDRFDGHTILREGAMDAAQLAKVRGLTGRGEAR